MEHVIQFTITEAFAVLLSICGGIITVAGAVTIVIKIINAAKKPNKEIRSSISEQSSRIDTIEDRLDSYEEYFKRDLTRIEAIEEGNRVTQRALLALLSHGIDGNDVDSLKQAKTKLEEYLTSR